MATIEEKLVDILNQIKMMKGEQTALQNGDYYKDGLIYCGKCNTQKEAIVQFFGKVPCMCNCEKDEYEARQKKMAEESRQVQLRNKRGYCFDSMALWGYTFDDCTIKEDPLYTVAYNYAKNFSKMLEENQGLMFFGTTGNGKTYLAAAIANYVLEQGYTCRMTSITTIEQETRENDGSATKYIKELVNNDLLILDDLAAERSTEYMREVVQNIVDRRYTTHKPLIVTTNLTAAELKDTKDRGKNRIYSRLLDMTIPVNFSGKDMRLDSLKSKYEKYKDILELPDKKGGKQ